MVKLEEKKLKRSEVNYFKEILEERKIQILKNINGVSLELNQLNSCELKDQGDHVAKNNHSMVDNIILEQQKQELRNIDTALSKIASGEYGTCDMCGAEIGIQRLRVKPHAIYCIECRGIVEKTEELKC